MGKGILGLPSSVGGGISKFLSPLARSSLLQCKFKKKYKQTARAWDVIFKDEAWLQTVMDEEGARGPVPTLVGSGLTELCDGTLCPSSPIYLALVTSDWGGGLRYQNGKLFSSFRDQGFYFNPASLEVHFENSGIILHIGDALTSGHDIMMRDPSRLFRQDRGMPETCVLYYGSDDLYHIDPNEICGVADFDKGSKGFLGSICSIPLRFRNGHKVTRVVAKGEEESLPFARITIHDEYAVENATNWRSL